MKRKDRLIMEGKLHAMGMDASPVDQQHIWELEQRAHTEYLRRQKKKESRRHFARRLAAVPLLACGIFLTGIILNAVVPDIGAYANGFAKRVIVWVNNALQLDIEIPMPHESGLEQAKGFEPGKKVYATVEEAQAFVGIPLVHFSPLPAQVVLDTVTVESAAPDFWIIAICYKANEREIRIQLQTLSENQQVDVFQDGELLTVPIGKLFVTSDKEVTRAIGIYDDSLLVQIRSDIPAGKTKSLCKLLKTIN